jgi:uncharacterized membrane protein YkvA (DUF1232 family)
MLSRITIWARALKTDVHAVYLAARDPRMPWPAKILAIAVTAYALSPIDLIPDFVPVLGYLDDLLIVPLGIWLVVKLVPDEVMAEYRDKARAAAQRPISKAGMIAIIIVWSAAALLLGWLGYRYWTQSWTVAPQPAPPRE